MSIHRQVGADRLFRVGLLALVLIVLMPIGLAPSWAETARPGTSTAANPEDKIASSLQRRLAEEGPQTVWLDLGVDADTSGAAAIEDWGDRGRYVVDQLRKTAKSSQAPVREVLDVAGVTYESYWISNAIRVDNVDPVLAMQLAAEPSVQRVFAPVKFEQPEPVVRRTSSSRTGAQAEGDVEWGVADVKADQVWRDLAVRGDGIVVANIDTGVQFDHPALVNSYRGFDPDTGTVDHDYNWLDVSGSSAFPGDGNGHGTHTMGTMVGDDGAANRTGVAPGARWIAANGCCPSDAALLESAQWMLAPTRVDGSDPDPAKRPHVINNSWGSTQPSVEPFIEEVLTAWADAGIFGVFANGNLGAQGCGSASSPGSRTVNYSVGAYDVTGAPAAFSGRGPGQDGQVKPDIAAPGVNVRSSLPGGRYGAYNGTSMATPHVAAAVALLWSADSDLVGDISGTRALLDGTAVDAPNSQCGGTDDDNNVFGEGKLDTRALVESTQAGTTGRLTGTVTEATTGAPVRGAQIILTAGGVVRSARSDDGGQVAVTLPTGDYTVTVRAFGYESAETEVTIVEGESATLTVALDAAPGHAISGTVVDARKGIPVPGAQVTLVGSRFSTATAEDGTFTIPQVPGPAEHLLTVDGGGCARDAQRTVEVPGGTEPVTVGEIALARVIDQPINDGWANDPAYGYSCVHEPTAWVGGVDPVERPTVRGVTELRLPFRMDYFGNSYDRAYVSRSGILSFWTYEIEGETRIDEGLWVDHGLINFDEQSRILTRMSGRAPNRTFTVEWRDVGEVFTPGVQYSFAITLHESGDIVYGYQNIDADQPIEQGIDSEVGLHGPSPEPRMSYGHRFVYSDEEPVLGNARQIRFTPPPRGHVVGRVLAAKGGAPVAGASVDLVNKHGRRVMRTETDANGGYRLELLTGNQYTVQVLAAPGYQAPAPVSVRLTRDGQVQELESRLSAGRIYTSADEVVAAAGKDAVVRLRNTGDASLAWRMEYRATPAAVPAPGTQTGAHATGLGAKTGVEQVDDTWWVSAVNYTKPVPWILAETTTGGRPTGRSIDPAPVARRLGLPVASIVPGDLAWLPSRGWLCMILAAGSKEDEIVCVDPDTSAVTEVIPTGYGTDVLLRGLAYDEEADVFYVVAAGTQGGYQYWHRALTGPEHADIGREVGDCRDTAYSYGLAWDPATRSLWTNGTGHLRQVDPDTCTPMSRVAPTLTTAPQGFQATDVDDNGNLLMTFALSDVVGRVAATDPAPRRPVWVQALTDTSGRLEPGKSVSLKFRIDWSRVPTPTAQLVLRGNGGERTRVVVGVRPK